MTAERSKAQARTKKAKDTMIRRQNFVFFTMLLVGGFLLVMSQFTDQRLLSEGIAFIIVGFVGLLMSWTTSDVGQRIIDTVDKAGAKISESLDMISANQKEISANQQEISASLKHVTASLDKIDKSQELTIKTLHTIAESQKHVIASLDKIDKSQEMTAKILYTIYESQQNDKMREKK